MSHGTPFRYTPVGCKATGHHSAALEPVGESMEIGPEALELADRFRIMALVAESNLGSELQKRGNSRPVSPHQ